MSGEVLAARYEKRERIATGGMGEVWRAQDTVLGREVAVKVLKHEYADDPLFRDRFANEARTAGSLHHPGVASVFDYGEEDGVPFLVMELVDGRPLSDLIAQGRPDAEQVRALAEQTAAALAVMHQRGLVHRDIKPGNLLVTPTGQVKITDFGIARAADGNTLTATGQVMGTPQYLSPEQAQGKAATPASDIYALGVVLFECLAGRRPYSKQSPVATALAHIREPMPDLPDDVPADLAAITRRAMAKDPADRYPDADALAAALRAGPDEDAGMAALVDPPTRVLTGITPTPATDPAEKQHEDRPAGLPWWRRVPLPLMAMGALAVLLLIALLFNLGSGNDAAKRPVDRPTPTGPTAPTTSTRATPSPTPSSSPPAAPSTSAIPSTTPPSAPVTTPPPPSAPPGPVKKHEKAPKPGKAKKPPGHSHGKGKKK